MLRNFHVKMYGACESFADHYKFQLSALILSTGAGSAFQSKIRIQVTS